MSSYKDLKKYILIDTNILNIIKNIHTQTNVPIDEQLTDNFINFTKQLNYQKLYTKFKNIDEVNNYIIKSFINIYLKRDYINIHNVLYNEIKNNTTYIMDDDSNNFNKLRNKNDPYLNDINSNKETLSNKNTESFNNKFNLNYNHIKYNDIIFNVDTRYQNLSNTDLTKFVFNVNNNMKIKTQGMGAINVVANITNIIQFEIEAFSIPYIPIANNQFKLITLRLNSFRADCIEHYEFDHHFIFSSYYNENTNRIELTPTNKIYKFRKPITELNDFSLTFGIPYIPLLFHPDRMMTTIIDYIANPGLLVFDNPHNLTANDNIIISDFTTLNPGEDQTIINQINNPNGFNITTPDPYIICVPVNLTLVKYPDPDLQIMVYFNSKRIICQIKVKYIYNDST
jgi:hypothetical protein